MSQRHADHQKASVPVRWTDRLIEGGALFLLVFTPLAFGTVEPWSEAIAELVVLGMVVAWTIGMLRDWELRIELPPGWLPASLFLALIFLQATPLPRALMQWVSPWTTGFYDAAAPYTAGTWSTFIPLSLAPHATWREALKLGAVAAFFLTCYNTYRTRAQARRAIWTMIIMGTLISIFGIVQRMTWNGHFYWIGPEAPHASAFGPFVNRAHFAGLIVIIVPMALALMLGARRTQTRKQLIHRWGDRLRVWNSTEAGPTNVVPILVLVMGGAALVSGSRGGVVALVAALLAMVVISMGERTRVAVKLAVVAALIACAGIWIGGDIVYGTVERLAGELERQDESPRLQIWTDAVRLWREAPVVGTGLASFGTVFPPVRTVPLHVVFTHAESDWIQSLTDTGAVGLVLGLMAGGGISLILLKRRGQAASRSTRTIALAGLVALIGTAVQGVANFNLFIMSNLIYPATALMLALIPRDGPTAAS